MDDAEEVRVMLQIESDDPRRLEGALVDSNSTVFGSSGVIVDAGPSWWSLKVNIVGNLSDAVAPLLWRFDLRDTKTKETCATEEVVAAILSSFGPIIDTRHTYRVLLY
jgi:hypothetical protein